MAISPRLWRLTISIVPLFGLASGIACSLALKTDDSVSRCSSSDDCPATGDNRSTSVCIANEDADIDGVCVAEFVPLSCDPMSYPAGDDPHPLNAYLDEFGGPARYGCNVEEEGKPGCPPKFGEPCLDGKEVDADNICPGADGALVNLGIAQGKVVDTSVKLDGQDIRDQFCKSFFCDDTYVCNVASCVPCDSSLPFGEGGCGVVYAKGERSCAYVLEDALEQQCAGPDADPNDPLFGECVAGP